MVCLMRLASMYFCAQACISSPLMLPLPSVSLLALARHCAQASVATLPRLVAMETCVSVEAATYSTCGPRASLAMPVRLRVILLVLVGSPQSYSPVTAVLTFESSGKNLGRAPSGKSNTALVAAPPEKHESFIITTWLALRPRRVRISCKSASMNRPSRTAMASVQRALVSCPGTWAPWPE